MVEEKIGVVEHFFTNVSVAAIKITDGELKVGDTIHIVGATTDFTQKIDPLPPLWREAFGGAGWRCRSSPAAESWASPLPRGRRRGCGTPTDASTCGT